MVKFIKLCIITLLTQAEAWCSQPLDIAPTTNKSLITSAATTYTVSLQMGRARRGAATGHWAWELHDHY